MKKFSVVLVLAASISQALWLCGQAPQPDATLRERPTQTDESKSIDFERARGLLQKRRAGESLTTEEEAYVRRAQAAIQARQNSKDARQPATELEARETTGLKPLTEFSGTDRYKGEDGGLYGQGSNSPPETHRLAALAELSRIRPLTRDGQPDPKGLIGFVSLSMSNATQEFSRFKQLADVDPAKSKRVAIVDCAQGGQAMAEWVRPDAPAWLEADRRVQAAGISPLQVQVAWIKLANKGPSGDLSEHGRKLQRDTAELIRNAKQRFPNLRIAYLSSRIYGGYATNRLNPEPYAYESAFAARWVIQDQINGHKELNFSQDLGEVKSPLLLWGPYLWADGSTPRLSDKLSYTRDDLAADGTHPSEIGRSKVARLLLNFFSTDPLAKTWFTGPAR